MCYYHDSPVFCAPYTLLFDKRVIIFFVSGNQGQIMIAAIYVSVRSIDDCMYVLTDSISMSSACMFVGLLKIMERTKF